MRNAGKFLLNGLLLSAVSLLLRAVGVSFNAYINAGIGAAGTGLFTLVMSVYSPALTLSTAGVNLAVSRLTAEELGKERGGAAIAVLHKALGYSLAVSGTVATLLCLSADVLSEGWLGSADAARLLRILSAGLPFTALSAAAGGYFNGVRRVSRNAAVQVFEQLFRIAVTVFALGRALPYGSLAGLTAVIVSSCAADAASCLLLLLLCRIDTARSGKRGRQESGILRRLLAITLPVSVSSFLRSGLVALEHTLIPKGLRKRGVSYEAAMASYGAMSGMAMPIILFPASFLYSFAGLLIPELAEAKERQDGRQIRSISRRVIGTVLAFSIGASGILFAFSQELGLSIYQNAEAAHYIRVLSPLIPIMYLDTAVDSILKGLGEQVFTMKVNILDATFSAAAVWLLVPALGLKGYVAVIFASELLNFAFSLSRLRKASGIRVRLLRGAALPLLAVLLSSAAARLLLRPLPWLPDGSGISALVGIPTAAGLYFLLLILYGVIPKGLPYRICKKMALALRGGKDEKRKEAVEPCR